MAHIIGIDLGTTNSCVAYLEGSEAHVIPNQEGARTTPSIVAFTDKGERLVGQLAKRQTIINPRNTLYAVKRLIGRRFESPEIEQARTRLPYELASAPNGDVRIKAGGKEWAPPEISAIVLQKLRDAAEAFLHEKVEEAIITCPAYFNDSQRSATRDAGVIAGLNVLRIINEPTAASLAYGQNRKQAEVIAVFDLGGGTFDISVLEMQDGAFKVLATAGDTYLGGEDFDQRIMDFLIEEFKQTTNIDIKNDKMALQRVKEAAEKAKCELSTSIETEVNLPFISGDRTGPKHLVSKLSRSKIEQLCEGLLDRTRGPCEQALTDAKIARDQVNAVLLVGGQTRMPRVQHVVEKIFGKIPNSSINPDEVVAIGAAIQGSIIKGDVKDLILMDVTPLSLGIETKGGTFTKIIERNTSIPTSKTMTFTTVQDNQKMVRVHVLQGERDLAELNKSLGVFMLTGIPDATAGTPHIDVSFSIDANGIVDVGAIDRASGNKQEVQITASSGLTESEIQRMIESAKQYSEEDKARKEQIKHQTRLESLIASVQASFNAIQEKLKSEDKQTFEAAMEEARKALEKSELEDLKIAYGHLDLASRSVTKTLLEAYGATPKSEDKKA
ncbi:MAG: molecular chaperone DnaK [Acidobacteriota bacterium]